uniref:Ubiquitin-like domain-containing protein n=1 Tax=Astatotilapia calliptera TaxID=8154 RepID=A0A3P8N5K5_ASTCA
MADEKPKESVKTENNEHINLKVAGQDGSVVQFKIKRHTPLIKLMKAYCERQGLSMRQIRFRFDGQPINETDTPAQVTSSCLSISLHIVLCMTVAIQPCPQCSLQSQIQCVILLSQWCYFVYANVGNGR